MPDSKRIAGELVKYGVVVLDDDDDDDGEDSEEDNDCLLYTSPSPRDQRGSRMPSSA